MGRVLGAMTIPGRLSSNINTQRGFPCGSAGKESTYNAGDLGWEDPLEEDMGIRILAWRIPWTEEPGGLYSMGHTESGTA